MNTRVKIKILIFELWCKNYTHCSYLQFATTRFYCLQLLKTYLTLEDKFQVLYYI